MLFAGVSFVGVPDYLTRALQSEHRDDYERSRDEGRKPGEVLTFFELEEGDKVVDLMTGPGYYTEILARAVGEKGTVYAHNSPFIIEKFGDAHLVKRLQEPGLENVKRLNTPLDNPELPGGLDLVTMFLFYHDTYWQEVDREKMNRAVFQALKSGGIYGIVDHRSAAGRGAEDVSSLHRVEASLVRSEIEAAGFVFVGESDLLTHPEDGHDYNVLERRQTDRDQTDRFILKFRKP